ncbi:MAG: BPSS1780 family membrane protein, partial [Paraburkholderia nemoris]
MQLIEVPAKTGYVWFRQGIWLFRKNPLAFLTLFFTYLLVMTLAAQIPVVGGVLPLVFIPGVAVGFMAACRNTIAGKPVFPTILVDGFHSYGSAVAKRLLVLGVLYVVAMAL